MKHLFKITDHPLFLFIFVFFFCLYVSSSIKLSLSISTCVLAFEYFINYLLDHAIDRKHIKKNTQSN